MRLYGDIFFNISVSGDSFTPLSPAEVQENVQDRAALKEFKTRYSRFIANKRALEMGEMARMSERTYRVLSRYQEGLKHFMSKAHPWVAQGINRMKIDDEKIARGRRLLLYLGLSPSTKNARRVLEAVGFLPPHANVEKYIMNIRLLLFWTTIEQRKTALPSFKTRHPPPSTPFPFVLYADRGVDFDIHGICDGLMREEIHKKLCVRADALRQTRRD